MDVKQPIQKIVTWSKANPLMAGVLVVGAIILGYLASKSMGKDRMVSGKIVDDAAGIGLGGDEDTLIPLIPYTDFDPVSGIPTLPTSTRSRSDDGDDDTPIIHTLVSDIVDPDVWGGLSAMDIFKKTRKCFMP